jgi:hypothetical protein
LRRLDHRVGSVGDDDPGFLALRAVTDDQFAVGVGQLQAVNHHQRAESDLHARSSQAKHLGQVRVSKAKAAADLVIGLVEGAAGDEDANHPSLRSGWP